VFEGFNDSYLGRASWCGHVAGVGLPITFLVFGVFGVFGEEDGDDDDDDDDDDVDDETYVKKWQNALSLSLSLTHTHTHAYTP
jgi:hypothetical protein